LHTLAQLQSGELQGIKRLQIAEQLTEFPEEIFALAETLEILDLSNNQLSHLPDEFTCLHKLKIVFLSNNQFEHIPKVLANCTELEMIGFKANQISVFAEHALPINTRWLILTDNKIEKLPNSIGQLTRLQKLMLAGNSLMTVPDSLMNCKQLQLIRLSANQLQAFPENLLNLPQLAWFAFSGNPFSHQPGIADTSIPHIKLVDVELLEILGEGASGVIYKAKWINKPAVLQNSSDTVAIKLFKGDVTSDGYPADELQVSLSVGNHNNLSRMIGRIEEENQLGLVMDLIPASYNNLGLPPSLESCTRDTFTKDMQFSIVDIIKIMLYIADTLTHLHRQGICHGDLYAHNILFNAKLDVLLGDFGASSIISGLPEPQQHALQAIELRAYGHLFDDLLRLCRDKSEKTVVFEVLLDIKNNILRQAVSLDDIKNALLSLQEGIEN